MSKTLTPEELREQLTRRESIAKVREDVAAKRAERRAAAKARRIEREARLTGQQARTRYDVYQSGEARAQRISRTRTLALALLVPVLCAFGAWSAAGVQAGMVTLLSLEPDSAAAMMAWLVEPALLGIVAGIIIIRAQLQSAGGDLDERAVRIEFGALATSILLNFAGHWPEQLNAEGWAALAGHALGPIGAAGTAYLISLVQDGVTHANPWTLDDGTPAPSLVDSREDDQESEEDVEETPESPQEDHSRAHELALIPPAGAPRLAVVECCRPVAGKTVQKPRRSTDDQAERPVQKSAPADSRKARADKGTKVPAAAKKAPESDSRVSPRRLSDFDLAVTLQERIDSRELPESPTVKAVQESLSVGFERAKRVLALQQERTETVAPGQLSVVENEGQEVAA
ncbi:hypothetical protein [Nocardiopsis sp. YSL2]|uniref:hypothetical protein n=1 Tax=Nocardiopsis sp. YSL2 TaxID=2939492 RepID=UPI0026F41121|nr:hypothetical protein [Nocardiopsis sp. YSL2]